MNIKAITTIPGWSEILNDELRKMGSSGGPYLYKKSVWANRCVNLKADALAGIPWGFFNKKDEEEVEKPNLYRNLYEANKEENWNDVIRGTGADLDIYGAAYWEKLGESTIVGVSRVNPSTMKPLIKKSTGEIVGFQQKLPGGQKKTFQREEIVYFTTYNPDNDLKGLSLLEVARYSIMTEIKANEYLAAFFANNALPAAILATEQQLQDNDLRKLKRWWDRLFKGTSKQHKVGFIDKGLKPYVLGYNNQELALKDIREESRRDIAASLGVPPALAGAWEAANYAASSEQRQSFYTETIIPRAEYMASVINAELIQQMDTNVKFGWKYSELDVMQPDMESERNSIANLVTAGVINPLAGARYLGFDDADAGIGPVQTRIVDQNNDVSTINDTPSRMAVDLEKWRKKAFNSLQKQEALDDPFVSEHIPKAVNDVIYSKLGKAKSKEDVYDIFGGFL